MAASDSPGNGQAANDDGTPRTGSCSSQYENLLDKVVPDPSGMAPLCDESTFAAIMEGMVADEAPRLFAVVQEYGRRVDARIAAWGVAFDDRAEVVGIDRNLRMSLQHPQQALRGFHIGSRVQAHLVWFNPDAVTPADTERSGIDAR